MSALADDARRWLAARFDGEVSPWPLALFRIGLALLVLTRTVGADLGLGLSLDHYAWVQGIEYAPSVEHVHEPALHAPILPMPRLSAPTLEALAISRVVLALLLLVGLWPRPTALALGVIGWGLMAYDRHRYLHHLHLLWVSCAWLALAPTDARLSPMGRLRASPGPAMVPRWSLQLLRLQLLVAYAAAGLAKLRADWLSGDTLGLLERAHLLHGRAWELARHTLGLRGLATSIACTEVLLVVLLASRSTRRIGIALAVVLHGMLELGMMLSTFSALMVLYVTLFLPWRETVPDTK